MAGTGVGEERAERKAVNVNSTSLVSFVGITERAHLSRQDGRDADQRSSSGMLGLKPRTRITSAGNAVEVAKRRNTYPKRLNSDPRD